jgi:hypothetical protein
MARESRNRPLHGLGHTSLVEQRGEGFSAIPGFALSAQTIPGFSVSAAQRDRQDFAVFKSTLAPAQEIARGCWGLRGAVLTDT